MSQKPSVKPLPDNVFRIGEDFDEPVAEEIQVGHKLLPDDPDPPTAQAMDLSDRLKTMVLLGLGGSGKTTFGRWIAEEGLGRGSQLKIAAIDPENRDMLQFFPEGGVYEPPHRDPERVAQWVKLFLAALVKERVGGVLDTGGGDLAFNEIIRQDPDLVTRMGDQGTALAAAYVLAPKVSALSPLATHTAAGFKPQATVLILNEGLRDRAGTREQDFAAVRRHSTYRAAIDRGAVELWMPRLSVYRKIDERRLQFRHAITGIVPPGRKMLPLGDGDQSIVRMWLRHMAIEMGPISSWIP